MIALGDELERKLSEMENKDEVLRELRSELARAAEKYLDAARTLSRRRYEAARKLEKQVESEINELAMKARFKVEVSGSDEEGNWSARGFDQVQYLISANPGEPLGPVEEIASGGELSRVMLALKTTIEAVMPKVEAPDFSRAKTGAKISGASAWRRKPSLVSGKGVTAVAVAPFSAPWSSTRLTAASAGERPRLWARS